MGTFIKSKGQPKQGFPRNTGTTGIARFIKETPLKLYATIVKYTLFVRPLHYNQTVWLLSGGQFNNKKRTRIELDIVNMSDIYYPHIHHLLLLHCSFSSRGI